MNTNNTTLQSTCFEQAYIPGTLYTCVYVLLSLSVCYTMVEMILISVNCILKMIILYILSIHLLFGCNGI